MLSISFDLPLDFILRVVRSGVATWQRRRRLGRCSADVSEGGLLLPVNVETNRCPILSIQGQPTSMYVPARGRGSASLALRNFPKSLCYPAAADAMRGVANPLDYARST